MHFQRISRRINCPSDMEKLYNAWYFLQKAKMERVPILCPFSLESGSPSSEKETGSLHTYPP